MGTSCELRVGLNVCAGVRDWAGYADQIFCRTTRTTVADSTKSSRNIVVVQYWWSVEVDTFIRAYVGQAREHTGVAARERARG